MKRNDMQKNNKENYVVSTQEKFFYGLGDFAINIAYGAIGFYLMFFFTDVAGLEARLAGMIFLIARIWDAVSDYLMGYISDKTSTRMGKRRPFILLGSVPFGFFFALLWLVPFTETSLQFLYYITITILFNTAFTIVAVPYNAMLPDMTQNYDERTALSGYKMGLSFVGTLVAAAGTMIIVDMFFEGKQEYLTSFPVAGTILGVVISLSLLLTFRETKERITHDSQNHENLAKTFLSVMQLQEFRMILGMFLFNMIGFDLLQVILIYLLKHVVRLSEDFTFVIMAIPLVIAVASTPFWVKLATKLGKKKTYIISAFYFTSVLLLCLVAPPQNIWFIVLITTLAGVGISASQVIPYSIIPDVIEIDEYRNGRRREGAFYGIILFLYKVASAAAVSSVAFILAYFGYLEKGAGGQELIEQPQSAIIAIRFIAGLGPGIFFLISAFFVNRLAIDKENFEAIKKKIENKKQQK